MAINFILGGAAVYGLMVGGMYVFQETMLFPRRAAAVPSYPLPARAERVTLQSDDGFEIVGTLVPARRASRGVLLGFGGNVWNADDATVFLSHRVHDFDIVVFHYRGYAPSEGEPSEAALFADSLAIHDWAVDHLQPTRVVATGFSLGTGVVAYLASQRRLDGMVLVTPFDSIEAIARARYGWMPVGPLLRHPFRSDLYLKDVQTPAAVIIASDDGIISPERSQALVNVLQRPVMVEIVPGSTHNGIYDLETFDDLLREALDRLERATAQPPEQIGAPKRTPTVNNGGRMR